MRNEIRKDSARARDPDLAGSEAALRGAATRAREQARRSTGHVVVYRNGKIVEDWVGERVTRRGVIRRHWDLWSPDYCNVLRDDDVLCGDYPMKM